MSDVSTPEKQRIPDRSPAAVAADDSLALQQQGNFPQGTYFQRLRCH